MYPSTNHFTYILIGIIPVSLAHSVKSRGGNGLGRAGLYKA